MIEFIIRAGVALGIAYGMHYLAVNYGEMESGKAWNAVCVGLVFGLTAVRCNQNKTKAVA